MYLVAIQSVFTAIAGSRLRRQRTERRGSLRLPVVPPAPRGPVRRDADWSG